MNDICDSYWSIKLKFWKEFFVLFVHSRAIDKHILMGKDFFIFGNSNLSVSNIEICVVTIEEAIS